MVHRDLKLENIFINSNSGEIKIGDLGLARTMDQKTQLLSCVGERRAPRSDLGWLPCHVPARLF